MDKPESIFRVLHTSDWHLGRRIGNRSRDAEFQQFLDWLYEKLVKEDSEGRSVDLLLIAGDVYNTMTPSTTAREQYYNFLARLAENEHLNVQVVVVAGNHDSNGQIDAPQAVLRHVNTTAIGGIDKNNLARQIVEIKGKDGEVKALVVAVPFLRDADMRYAEAMESERSKMEKLKKGIEEHYLSLASLAEARRQELGLDIPVLATGHLFTLGGEGSRETEEQLYVGTALEVDSSALFPATFDYVALGHLHKKQKVSSDGTRRYCGAPLPMSFGEAKNEQSVCLLECRGRQITVEEHAVPRFRAMITIKGQLNPSAEALENGEVPLLKQIENLRQEDVSAWLQVLYTGAEEANYVIGKLNESLKGSQLDLISTKAERDYAEAVAPRQEVKALKDYGEFEVFEMLLNSSKSNGKVSAEDFEELRDCYRIALEKVNEDNERDCAEGNLA